MNGERTFPPTHAVFDRVNAFLRGVYGWMCGGLTITAVTASLVSASPTIVVAVTTNRLLFWALVIVQLGIVFTLSARVERLAASTAAALFIVYSILTGVTLSLVLLALTAESVTTTFVVTAAMFGSLALYGSLTRSDLTGLGAFLFMGLVGVVLASIVSIFWQSDAFQFVLSLVGVVVFTGLTAYDANRLRAMALAMAQSETSAYAVAGALALYLDFINLFLFMLRFLGQRRH
jgi:FtsH-binding integral membrane protein